MSDVAKITEARRAVWDAIDNWAALRSGGTTPIKRKFKYDDAGDGIANDEPSYEDLPAVKVWPGTIDIKRETNVSQGRFVVCTITLWTPDWYLPAAERGAEDILDAIYKSAADLVNSPKETYVKVATGQVPWAEQSVSFQRIRFNGADGSPTGPKAIMAQWVVTLRRTIQPYPQVN